MSVKFDCASLFMVLLTQVSIFEFESHSIIMEIEEFHTFLSGLEFQGTN